jgi:ACT domain-containing protein
MLVLSFFLFFSFKKEYFLIGNSRRGSYCENILKIRDVIYKGKTKNIYKTIMKLSLSMIDTMVCPPPPLYA